MNKSKKYPENVEKLIEEILSNFDFEKVNKVMKFLNWTWRDQGVPNHYELIKAAKERLYNAYEQMLISNTKDGYISSGGFAALCYKDEDTIYFKLEFILTDWDSEFIKNI